MTTIMDTGQAQATEEVLFRSRGRNFRAVIKPATRRITDYGTEPIPGESVDFAPHGEFRTSDPRIIGLLRQRASFNNEFWEVGNEPGRASDPQLVLEAISAATIELDDARLAEIECEEQAGEQRPVVLQSVAAARLRVQRVDAEAQASPPAAGPDVDGAVGM